MVCTNKALHDGIKEIIITHTNIIPSFNLERTFRDGKYSSFDYFEKELFTNLLMILSSPQTSEVESQVAVECLYATYLYNDKYNDIVGEKMEAWIKDVMNGCSVSDASFSTLCLSILKYKTDKRKGDGLTVTNKIIIPNMKIEDWENFNKTIQNEPLFKNDAFKKNIIGLVTHNLLHDKPESIDQRMHHVLSMNSFTINSFEDSVMYLSTFPEKDVDEQTLDNIVSGLQTVKVKLLTYSPDNYLLLARRIRERINSKETSERNEIIQRIKRTQDSKYLDLAFSETENILP